MIKQYNHLKMKLGVAVLLVVSDMVMAADSVDAGSADANACTGKDIGRIACNIMQSFENIGHLIKAIAYIAGIGFFVVSIFKFKQHKDNPTQIPVGTPIAYFCVGSALVFIPSIMDIMGQTVFDEKATVGGFMGEGVKQIGK